jgi:hypothetical protein
VPRTVPRPLITADAATQPPHRSQAAQHDHQGKGRITFVPLRRLRLTLASCDRDWDNGGRTGPPVAGAGSAAY